MNERWSYYFMKKKDDLEAFWKYFLNLKKRDVLFILGQGFDPRMCDVISVIMNIGGIGKRDCIALDYDEGINSSSHKYDKLIDKNKKTLIDLVAKRGNIDIKKIQIWSDDKRRVASVSAARIFQNFDEFFTYTDIIVDVSAMPRSIYFPLIHKILLSIDTIKKTGEKPSIPNLHVVVSEDCVLDGKIRSEGILDNASYLHSFGAIDLESNEEMPKVWIPILGEGKQAQLNIIRDFVNADEICPLLPFPSRKPRRGDDIIGEYRGFLFDDIRIQPQNIIYADEQNPFQVYRQINKTINDYQHTLKILGGCKIIISPLSSKLLSIGALLAVYEARRKNMLVGVAYVESHGYRIDRDIEDVLSNRHSELFELWLAGECYEEH